MASFEFSLNNGLPLIMTAGGSTPSGFVFVAGKNDIVFEVNGDYSMAIDSNNNVTITLNNLSGLIFPNRANNSSSAYYDTIWARNHNNCMSVYIDVALSQQAHGGWSDGNQYWQFMTGWKGGSYNKWVKYVNWSNAGAYEPCVGTAVPLSASGPYYSSRKYANALVFSLGQVDFNTTKGFWIGANLNVWAGGYEKWQYVEFPIIVFESPNISKEITNIDVCEEKALVAVSASSSSSFATAGGSWIMQIATKPDYSDAREYSVQNTTNTVTFDEVEVTAGMNYYVRVRLKVSDIRYSNWATTTISVSKDDMPSPNSYARDIDEFECHKLRHGLLVEGGVI